MNETSTPASPLPEGRADGREFSASELRTLDRFDVAPSETGTAHPPLSPRNVSRPRCCAWHAARGVSLDCRAKCSTCNGTGRDGSRGVFNPVAVDCPVCGGSGFVAAPVVAVPEAGEARVWTDTEMTEALRQRDEAEEWADRLASTIARAARVDIGEHTSANNPWANALHESDRLIRDGGWVS